MVSTASKLVSLLFPLNLPVHSQHSNCTHDGNTRVMSRYIPVQNSSTFPIALRAKAESITRNFTASLVPQTVKNLPAMQGSVLGLGRSPGQGNGNALQYSCLENLKDRGDCPVGLQSMGLQSQTGLSTNTVTFKALWEPRPTLPQLHTPHLCPLSSQAPPAAHPLSDTGPP